MKQHLNFQISMGTIAAIAVLAGASFLFHHFPQVDISTAHALYLGKGQFLLSNNALSHIIDGPVDLFLKFGFLIAAVVYLLLCIIKFKIPPELHQKLFFLFITIACAELLIINFILKNHWGRARPVQLAEFNGPLHAHFTPAWDKVHECLSNCSFTSGHAGMAACTALLAVFFPPQWRGPYLVVSLAFVALAGFIRMAHGAHFLSDVTLSPLIVLATAMVVKDAMRLKLN